MVKIMKEVCGMFKSTGRKETWWWNSDAVKKALKEKKVNQKNEDMKEAKKQKQCM